MATVNSASLRDEFDAYKADIVSLRKEGEITEKTDKVLTGLCDLVTILTAAFLEKTTKKTSKNSSIPPLQTGKDETRKPRESPLIRARKKIQRRVKTSRRLLSRKSPLSKPVAIAATIFRTLSQRLVKNVFCTISVTRLQN